MVFGQHSKASTAQESRSGRLEETLRIIDRLAIFEPFSDAEKRQIVSDDAHFKVYQPGERLIRMGSSDRNLFVLLSGTVTITDGTGETQFATLKAGDIFGEMAFLTDTRRTANVVAATPAIALKLDRVHFDRLSPAIREKFKDKMIEKLVLRLDRANHSLARLDPTVRVPSVAPKSRGTPVSRGSDEKSGAPGFEQGRKLIRKILSRTADLPVMPAVMLKVQQKIRLPGTSPLQLTQIIENDPAIVAGLLKMANSAYYGFRGKVSTIRHAAALFGTRRLAELVTAMSSAAMLGSRLEGYGLRSGDLWRHAIAVGRMAAEIASVVDPQTVDHAHLSGLLHDVGKLILDPYLRERKMLFDHYCARNPETSIDEAERDILGFDHAVIAAILCKHWDLPRAVSFGIRHHHQPAVAGEHKLSHIVHLANHLVAQTGLNASGPAPARKLDESCRSVVPLDADVLQPIIEKVCGYTESMAGQLLAA